jgi:hypothetical protein
MSRAIFKSTSVVGLTTLLSRITGLLRDMVYSQAFGAGTLMVNGTIPGPVVVNAGGTLGGTGTTAARATAGCSLIACSISTG